MKKDDAEPAAAPGCAPPEPTPVTAAQGAAGLVAVAGAVAADIATGGLVSAVLSVPGFGEGETQDPHDDPRIQAALAGTAAPVLDRDGKAPCTRCGQSIPFASMSLCEHGYFCSGCAHTADGDPGGAE